MDIDLLMYLIDLHRDTVAIEYFIWGTDLDNQHVRITLEFNSDNPFMVTKMEVFGWMRDFDVVVDMVQQVISEQNART
jgi:hypothetical protein